MLINQVLYTIYSHEADVTFIMRDTFDENTNECISTEVTGFYYGEPNARLVEKYNGKLKAEF